MTEPASKDDIQDLRSDVGILVARAREEWRNEVKLVLKSFKNEMRLYIVATVLILKFNLPPSLTVAAVGVMAVKMAVGFLRF